jgi:hypothetical protein
MKLIITNLYESPPANFEEFVAGCAQWRFMTFEDRCEFLFTMLDQDNNNTITASDITIFIQHMNGYHVHTLLIQFELGDKVKVKYMLRNGTLRYWGTVKFEEGFWAGLELTEPTGTHNGEVDGEVYFQTKEKHGKKHL